MKISVHSSSILFGTHGSRSGSRHRSPSAASTLATPLYTSDSVTIYGNPSTVQARPAFPLTSMPPPMAPSADLYNLQAMPPDQYAQLMAQEQNRRTRTHRWRTERVIPVEEPLGVNAPPHPDVYRRRPTKEEEMRSGFSHAPNKEQSGVFFDSTQGEFTQGRAPRTLRTTYEKRRINTSSVYTTTGGPDRTPVSPTVMNKKTLRQIQEAGEERKEGAETQSSTRPVHRQRSKSFSSYVPSGHTSSSGALMPYSPSGTVDVSVSSSSRPSRSRHVKLTQTYSLPDERTYREMVYAKPLGSRLWHWVGKGLKSLRRLF